MTIYRPFGRRSDARCVDADGEFAIRLRLQALPVVLRDRVPPRDLVAAMIA
jgi:hypothetical protein